MKFTPAFGLLVAGLLPNIGSAQTTIWQVAPPTLSIGSAAGSSESTFGSVVAAVELQSGEIVVADAHASAIRFFSSEGDHLRSVGRSGGGPGEYVQIRRMAMCGADTLAVYDGDLNRITILSPEGEYTRSFAPPAHLGGLWDLSCNAQGVLLVASWPRGYPSPAVEGPFRPTFLIALLSTEGEMVASLGEYPAGERYMHLNPSAGRATTRPRPLGATTELALSSESLYVADGAAGSIRVISLAGLSETAMPYPAPERPITRRDLNVFIERQVEAAPPASQPGLRRYYRELRYPDRYPRLSQLLVSSEGDLWIRDYPDETADEVTWVVIEEGVELFRVRAPRRLTLTQASRGHVLGIWRDELGVQYVQKRPLRPLETSASVQEPEN